MSRRTITSRQRRRIIWFTQHGPVAIVPCHWCGKPLTFDEATVDHEPALAEGGKWNRAVIACKDCNQVRGLETKDRIEAKKAASGL